MLEVLSDSRRPDLWSCIRSCRRGHTINGPHASLDCTTCHANGQFKAPAKETCFQCHQSYQTVAERTAKMNPNPHSNHRGEKDCNACHSMHGKSHFECNDCHNFAIRMKGE
ncbi:MAG: cytochrome c3 family protein [Sutterella wadsworthensis]